MQHVHWLDGMPRRSLRKPKEWSTMSLNDFQASKILLKYTWQQGIFLSWQIKIWQKGYNYFCYTIYWKYRREITTNLKTACGGFLTTEDQQDSEVSWSFQSSKRKWIHSSGYNSLALSPLFCPPLPAPNLTESTMQGPSAGSLHMLCYLFCQPAAKHLPLIFNFHVILPDSLFLTCCLLFTKSSSLNSQLSTSSLASHSFSPLFGPDLWSWMNPSSPLNSALWPIRS